MSEKRILIASLLKPVNDTRMYEKMAISLSKRPHTTVHVVGYEAVPPAKSPSNIRFHPIFRFRRLSPERAVGQVKFYRFLLKVKPHIIIASTHELLPVSFLYCLLHPCKLVYDIQENYALNLRSQQNYHPLLKRLMASTVRGIEQVLAPRIAHFLVAEQTYLRELPFLKQRATLVENKYKPAPDYQLPATPVLVPSDKPLRLLYSGTIADLYGIFEAVQLAAQLHQLQPGTTLTIIGYCAQEHTLAKLKAQIKNKPYINLIGGETLVPHQQIIEQIKQSDVGLLPYLPNESTFHCIPTKIYEYMGHALPLVIQENPTWKLMVSGADAGISIDFRTADLAAVKKMLQGQTFYRKGIPPAIFWDTEEQKLLTAMDTL